MRLFPLRVLVALTAFVLLASASTGNAATVVSMRVLPGTQLPLVRQSARLATTADSTPVSVVLSLQPRNRALLARAASGHTPMSDAQLRSNFAPSRGNVVAITRYMQSHGFRLTSSGLLSLSFSGDAGSARGAFGVGISTYRSPSGRVFRAPDGAVKLPAGLAPLVEDVSGLDTALRLERHTSISPGPHTVTPSCTGSSNASPGYQPDELAQAYHHNTLIAAGGDGSGQTIGLVEFTNYRASDIATYESCYTNVNSPASPVFINGGAGTQDAAIEAELDIEVVVSNAPGVNSVRVYSAPNNVSQILPMLDQMVNDHVTVVSDSWGLCEPFLPPSFMEAESTHLETLAATGISFFAATGDSGSSDCAGLTSGAVKGLYTDDPSSQPFATAVGGTTLQDTLGDSTTWVKRSSTQRLGGGGGVSALWPQPSYQAAYQAIHPPTNPNLDTGAKCGNFTGGVCRETPDVALDANPDKGYIVYCTFVAQCGPDPWITVGGTSGSAPLMAAIAADANTYSLANPGTHAQMGFANPFLYSQAGTFKDVTQGNNNIYVSTGNYFATANYDMATGLGSPNAMALATALTSYTPGPVTQDATQLAITGPSLAKTVVYGKPLIFHGTLMTSADAPIANRRVYLELREGAFLFVYVARSDINGVWSVTLTKQLQRNLTWSVNFPGSDTEAPAKATNPPGQNAIHVIPHLSSGASATSVRRGVAFTFHGASLPNMHGVAVAVQARRSTSTPWRTLRLIAVAKNGTFTVRVSTTTPGPLFLRWVYAGGVTRPWLSAVSLPRRVNIT